jgi:5-methyltetrahydropteroyltriglutamate--homocysteine methyltransferase
LIPNKTDLINQYKNMYKSDKLFPVTQVGSWPRSRTLLKALRDKQKERITKAEFDEIANAEAKRCIQYQLDAGVDILVEGEHHRDNFYSFLTDKLEGSRLMSLADMLDTVDNKESFEEMLDTLDVPASSIKNPTCVGKLSRREPLTLDEFKFVKSLTNKPVKITLPGPYLLTRSMWVGAFSKQGYNDKQEMADDIIAILREELADLQDAGCEFVQFDEPVLTEIVMSEDCDRRTFM